VLPGAGFGRAGVPGAYGGAAYAGWAYGGAADAGAFYGDTGSYYASDEAIAEQASAVNDSASAFPAYSSDAVVPDENSWQPTNLTAPSIYTKPSYREFIAAYRLPPQPVFYDYGGNVVVQSDAVYVNGEMVGAPQDYAEQASHIAAAGSVDPRAGEKWLPLGVFAVVEGAATTSNDVFLLAINKQGVVRGDYHNVNSNEMTIVRGSLDREFQRVAWVIGEDQLPVYEAGLANLTKDATPILVHLPDGQSHQVTLIRLTAPPSE
jgi:hypothetical protein